MTTWNLDRIRRAFAEASLDPSLWVAALDIAAIEANGFGAVLLPATSGALPNAPYTAGMAASFEVYFRDGWYLRNDGIYGSSLLRGNDGYDLLERAPPTVSSAYYREVLEPYGLRWHVNVRVGVGEDIWVLTIQRAIGQAPFSAEEKRRLVLLSRTLSPSLATSRMLGMAHGNGILDALDGNQKAAILIDREGRVIRSNAAADRLIVDDIQISSRRITSSSVTATAALDRSLHEVLWRREGAAIGTPVSLPRPSKRPILAYPMRFESQVSNPLSDCQAVVVLVDLGKRSRPPVQALKSVFNLTDAEARLAARLGSGEALDEICDNLAIAKETGRNQLKSIFNKTGTHRQAELVCLVMSFIGSADGADVASPDRSLP